MIRTRKLFALLVFCMTMVFSLGSISASHLERIEASPDWVKKLSAAQNAKQLFILAGVGQTTAWISLHEKGQCKMLWDTLA